MCLFLSCHFLNACLLFNSTGRHPVLPRARTPPRRQTLRLLGRHVERRLHLRRAAQQKDHVPGGQPAQAGRQDLRHPRHADAGGGAQRVRLRSPLRHQQQPPLQAAQPAAARADRQGGGLAQAAAAAARVGPGQADDGREGAAAPLPERGTAALPLVHVRLLFAHARGPAVQQ